MRPWESVSRRGGVGPRSGSILKRPAPWRRASRRSPAVGAGAGAKVTQSSRPPGSFAPTRAEKASNPAGLGFVRVLAPLGWVEMSGSFGFAAEARREGPSLGQRCQAKESAGGRGPAPGPRSRKAPGRRVRSRRRELEKPRNPAGLGFVRFQGALSSFGLPDAVAQLP
jgi:hypothetical protein